MAFEFVQGVHLHRTDENIDEIDALADRLGGRVGLEGVLKDLNRQARRSFFAFGRAVHRAYRWDRSDCRSARWWPQGITTSADASDTEDFDGRRLLVTTWYAKETEGVNKGSRISIVDLETLKYRHVLLVVPTLGEDGEMKLAPLKVHAGGIVWAGPYLHIAATSKGIMTCRVDDILRVPDERGVLDRLKLGAAEDKVASFGYRYVLPVRFSYKAYSDEGLDRLRYSFMSLDRSADPPELVVGEYGRGKQTTRLARYPIDAESMHLVLGDDGYSRPLMLDDGGVVQMQGIAVTGGHYYATASNGPVFPGNVYVGRPGDFRKHKWATPIGCEDLSYWPSRQELWSVTEHPNRRWIFSMRKKWFDKRS
ncbi:MULTISPECIES: hypothetical protein [unclassified Nocardioides]|uniref:hypothetical protein n=1 Tax=unclassified Nocardioides TaxID=2615069 RepID=UPI0006F2F136|nr:MULTISPECIES: hypothetical protein [unclassified Nocardioides]KQY56300.1 hypothetical protein ASD30_08060 [Nocardioides sp. Root140]KQZ75084.1 hypothetical protein ASD66_01525 [Nocardioides sp. Root151]KRF14159.1 hypothetical protein ASH02_07300 [Nocardioides sp. Soil796]